MGDMILIKATQEVKEVISFSYGMDENGDVEQYTIAEDGRGYTDDEFVTLATENEVDKAMDEFTAQYKRRLLNTWKYGKFVWLSK